VPEANGRGSIQGVNGVTIRPARPTDFEELRGVFARAKLGGPAMAPELAFVQGRLGGEAFVADAGGELVGASAAVVFGVNGWIGGVAVVPERRGGGLGSALTAAAAHWIAEAGASTASLHATAMGRPVYERLGFAADGRWLRLAVTAGAGPVETARTVAADSSAGVGAGEAGGRDAAMADPLPGMQAGEAIGLGLSAAGPPEEARPAGPGGLDATMEEQPPQERVGELGGLGPPDPPVGVRAGRASDLEAVLALDRAVTGEERGRLLRVVWGAAAWSPRTRTVGWPASTRTSQPAGRARRSRATHGRAWPYRPPGSDQVPGQPWCCPRRTRLGAVPWRCSATR